MGTFIGWCIVLAIGGGLVGGLYRAVRSAQGFDRVTCVYCKGSLRSGATVCPKCGRDQPPLRTRGGTAS